MTCLVPDLGTDAVLTYSLGTDGKLVEKEELRFSTAPGAGPRHLRVHPDGRHLFVLDELDSTLMVLRLDGRSLVPVSTVSTLGTGSFPEDTASEVQSRTVRPVCVRVEPWARQQQHRHVLFRRGLGEDIAGPCRRFSWRGTPGFHQSPDGRYLFVANQETDTIVTLEIDEDKPGLGYVSETEVLTPVSLLFP